MSQYNTGSVELTNGSAVVTGTSTVWLSTIAIADGFTLIGSGIIYDVQSVDSDTQITLSTPYTGVTGVGLAYTIIRDFTAVLGLPYPVQGDVDTASVVKNALNKLDAGITVTSFKHRGNWLIGTTYVKDDAVANAGRYFVSKVLNNTGHTPPVSPSTGDAFWGLISARGVQGVQGLPGAGATTWLAKAAAYAAVSGDGIAANTSTAAFTVTLPAIVAIGDTVAFIDAAASWGTNNLTIATSAANTIVGAASPLIADVSATPFSLIAVSLTDWRLF